MSLRDFIEKLAIEQNDKEVIYKKKAYNFDGKPKKMALLYILNILRNESDVSHPLKKSEILDILHYNGMDIDRKTAYSNIELLAEEGLISTDGRRKGYYFDDWLFDHSELYFLMEAVDGSYIISENQKKSLKKKLAKLGGKYFDESPVGLIRFVLADPSKQAEQGIELNKGLFLNISVVNEAIKKRKKISYDYCEYGLDKKLHKNETYEVSPYEVFMSNHHYYCKVGDELQGVMYHRLDYIKNIDITGRKSKGISEIIKYNQPNSSRINSETPPSKVEDKRDDFKIRADKSLISECMEVFGSRHVKFMPDKDDKNKMVVELKTGATAMELWTRRHLDTVEILQPIDLKVKMYGVLKDIIKRY